jgi:hypothetical protein
MSIAMAWQVHKNIHWNSQSKGIPERVGIGSGDPLREQGKGTGFNVNVNQRI